MKHTFLLYCTLCLLSIITVSAQSAPVYKVTKGDNSIYIGGTFHLLTPQDFPLQEAFYKAYKLADEVYFETDMAAISRPDFVQEMAKIMRFQNGETIQSALHQDTFERLKDYADSKGLPMQQLLPMTPTGLTMFITFVEYQARGFSMAGVDAHFFEKTRDDQKAVKWFEDIEQQLAFLGSINSEDPNLSISYMLDSMGELDALVSNLHDAWRVGDMDKLEAFGLSAFNEYPDMYEVFIKGRNDAWMLDIEPMFADTDTELILVGALHLPGEDGLLTQLQNKGYDIEQVENK